MDVIVTTPQQGQITGKLLLLHGGMETGADIKDYAGLDYLSDKHGFQIFYPTAPFKTWRFDGPAAAQQKSDLANMVSQPPANVPTIVYGYSRGARMAEELIIMFKALAGCIGYAGFYPGRNYGQGTAPILLVRNKNDRTISPQRIQQMANAFIQAGHANTTPMTGFPQAQPGQGTHMDLADPGLVPLFEQWILAAFADWKPALQT